MPRFLIALIACLFSTVGVSQELPPTPTFETGLDFIDSARYASIPLAAPRFAGTLPERIDLTPFAPIGDQGPQGSCVGWAVAYALKSYEEEQERRWGIMTTDHQFSPAYIYNQLRNGNNCKGGLTYVDALDLLTREGAAALSEFPYVPARCDDRPSALVKQRAKPYAIASWRRVNTLDETEIKTHLADGYPILIGMPVDATFMRLTGDGLYQGLSGPSLGGHAMVVTGYDNDRGAFKLLNSWGTSWGSGGTGWISYTAFRNTVREGYVVQDIISSPQTAIATTPIVIEVETVVFGERPGGKRSVTKTTGNHHCSSNCEGEPTRTNYRLELEATPGNSLRNPQLQCVAGPCNGWNAVVYVRLEADNKRAVASWDVWAHPTTWELSADEVRVEETSRFTRHIDVGESFTILAETGAPPPHVSGKFSTGETFSFVAGRPTLNRYIRFIGVEVQGAETVFQYETKRP